MAHLLALVGGDARRALTALEAAAGAARSLGRDTIDLETLEQAVDRAAVRYDRDGDQHYDVISAFIKSMRGSDVDAALHYLARMIEAGEDPRFIARRLVILASEDVGLADPTALQVAVAAAQALELIGLPEARLNLAQAIIHLALAPKTNAVITAIERRDRRRARRPGRPVPPHLRDAHYPGAKRLGARQAATATLTTSRAASSTQQYAPDEVLGRDYYRPSDRGAERAAAERLARTAHRRCAGSTNRRCGPRSASTTTGSSSSMTILARRRALSGGAGRRADRRRVLGGAGLLPGATCCVKLGKVIDETGESCVTGVARTRPCRLLGEVDDLGACTSTSSSPGSTRSPPTSRRSPATSPALTSLFAATLGSPGDQGRGLLLRRAAGDRRPARAGRPQAGEGADEGGPLGARKAAKKALDMTRGSSTSRSAPRSGVLVVRRVSNAAAKSDARKAVAAQAGRLAGRVGGVVGDREASRRPRASTSCVRRCGLDDDREHSSGMKISRDRRRFLRYFEARGHTVVPSASLVVPTTRPCCW